MSQSVDLANLLTELQKTQNYLSSESERQGFADEYRQNRNTQFIIDAINNGTLHTTDVVDRNGLSNFTATRDVESTVRETTAALGIQAEKLANELITYTSNGFRDINNNTRFFENNTSRDFHRLSNELGHVENNLVSKVDHGFAHVQLQAANNKADLLQYQSAQFAALQLQAANNNGEIASKMGDYASSIIDKIGSTDTERIRDAMRAAETKSAILASSCYPPCCRRGPLPPFPPFPPGPPPQ